MLLAIRDHERRIMLQAMRAHLGDLEREAAAWRARQEATRDGRYEARVPATDATTARGIDLPAVVEFGIVEFARKVNALEEPAYQASADATESRIRAAKWIIRGICPPTRARVGGVAVVIVLLSVAMC
jgi:hypothetical protein